jgi:hypothetical protein
MLLGRAVYVLGQKYLRTINPAGYSLRMYHSEIIPRPTRIFFLPLRPGDFSIQIPSGGEKAARMLVTCE